MKFVIKTLLVFVALFTLWDIVVRHKPEIDSSQNLLQDNIIKAEKYIFSDSVSSKVIVGSSMSAMLNMDTLSDFTNLAFCGLSAFDGLNIVKSRKDLPEVLLIEINALHRTESKSFSSVVYSPILNTLKETFPSIRINKQPITYFCNFHVITRIKDLKKRFTTPKKIEQQSTKSQNNNEENAHSSLFDKRIETLIKTYSKALDSTFLDNQTDNLIQIAKDFSEQGVNVIFFEMPINYQLENLIYPNSIRKMTINKIENQFSFIKQVNEGKYKTTDGIHLRPDEVVQFSIFLKKSMLK